MPNYTFEDYKKEIKAKYEIERNGEYSNNLNSPTTANLRNLCIKRFKSNNNKDDLDVFEHFFEFPFDNDKNNLFGDTELNKLIAVRRFFLGITENPSEDTVQFSAILVDFQPRPYNRFRNESNKEKLSTNLEYGFSNNENVSDDFQNSNLDFDGEKSSGGFNQVEVFPIVSKITRINQVKEKLLANFKRKLIITSITIGIVFLIIEFTTSFFKKDCMIWVNDHYEEVERSEQGYCDTYYDARYFDLKKIKACDTTTFFKNGKPIVWYIKISGSIECFDRFAPYPEDPNRFLRPITNHIIKTYLKNKPCK